MSKIVLGLIGGGNVGRIHVKNIFDSIKDVELRYVADPYPESYNEWAKNNKYPNAIEDYKLILEDPEVQGVLICAPAGIHADLIIECAKAKKHIFCEKPIDYDIAKIEKAIKVVDKENVKLQMGYNRRFDHNHAAAKLAVTNGEVGEIRHVKITSRDPLPPPAEYFAAIGGAAGGMFLDTSIHDIDMARFLVDDAEVEEIYATGSLMINKEGAAGGVDTVTIVLTFSNGVMAIINNSWQCAYGYDQRMEIFGSKGSVLVDNDTASTVKILNDKGQTAEKPLFFYVNRYIQSYTDEVKEFVDVIKNNKDVPVSAMDGYYSVLIAKACDISLKEKRVVQMSEFLN